MKPEMFVVIGVVIALTVLVKFLIVKISQASDVSRAAWLLSVAMGVIWSFFIVFSQMKAAEAERLVNVAQKEVLEIGQQAEKQRLNAEEARVEAERQAQNAYELSEKLKKCN